MAGLKRSFSKGKMNKDFDERIVPPGEYRDANNIEINTSEGSNVGAVQTIKGNTEKTAVSTTSSLTPFGLSHHTAADTSESTYGSPAVCIGSITDEKNDKIYSLIADGLWYINGTAKSSDDFLRIKSDYILEYNVADTLSTYPYKYVFNDIYYVETETSASSADTNLITVASNQGVRKGMIATFKISSLVYSIKVSHTLTYDDATKPNPNSVTKIWLEDSFAGTLANNTEIIFTSPKRVLNFDKNIKITGINIIDDLLLWTDNLNEPKRLNITRSIAGTGGAFSAGNFMPSAINVPFTGDTRNYHTVFNGGEENRIHLVATYLGER